MALIVLILHILIAAGLVLLGMKYLRGAVPLDYHAAMLGGEDVVIGPNLRAILTGLYRSVGATAAALGLAVALLGSLGFLGATAWPALAIFALALIAGTPSLVAVRRAEQVSGTRTPWRPTAALIALSGLACLLALL